MTSTKSLRVLLGSVSAAVLVAGFAASASAQTLVAGGGASLPANSIRTVLNCSSPDQHVNFNPTQHPAGGLDAANRPAGCPLFGADTRLFGYVSVGSGAGRRAYVQRDPNLLGVVSTGFNVPFDSTLQTLVPNRPKLDYDNVAPGTGYGVHHFSLSEEPLEQTTSANNDSYDCFTGVSCAVDQRIVTGEAMQLPFVSVPVTIGFNITNRTAQIRLSTAAYCGIFSGAIVDWNDPVIKASNNGNSIVPGNPNGAAPISAVFVRADGSGTNFLFTNHLSTVCAAAGFPFPAGFTGTTSPTQWPNSHYRIANNNGVANAVAKTAYSVGYMTPELTQPYVATVSLTAATPASQQSPLTGTINVPAGDAPAPLTARLQNPVSGNYIIATPGNAATAMASVNPPSGTDAANPVNWGAAGLLPEVQNGTGYPIAGFNWFMNYTCYANGGVSAGIRSFWSYVLNNPTFDSYRAIVESRGLGSMPANWRIQERLTALMTVTTQVRPSGPGSKNPNCDTNTFPNRTGA